MSEYNPLPTGERWDSITHEMGEGSLPQSSIDKFRHFLKWRKNKRPSTERDTYRSLALSSFVNKVDDNFQDEKYDDRSAHDENDSKLFSSSNINIMG